MNIKAIAKTIAYLQITAMFLTAALAGPAAAERQVPFKGSWVRNTREWAQEDQ